MVLRHGLNEVCRAECEATAARHGDLPETVDEKVYGPNHHGSHTYPLQMHKTQIGQSWRQAFQRDIGTCYRSIWKVSLEKKETRKFTQLNRQHYIVLKHHMFHKANK